MKCEKCKHKLDQYGIMCGKNRRTLMFDYDYDENGELIGCHKIEMKALGIR